MAKPHLNISVTRHKIGAGMAHAWYALKYSRQGLHAAWQHEEAFRQEVLLCVLCLPLALWLGNNAVEWALLLGSLFLVLIVELINSALEAVVDRHGEEIHPLSARAKDMGSAAVFLTLCLCGMIWLLLLGEKFFA
jgi:diacylglycerol kinase (ATP)